MYSLAHAGGVTARHGTSWTSEKGAMRISTRVDEAAEDCVPRMLLPRQKLLVPLDTDSKRMVRHFDRLNDAVARVCSRLDAAPNLGNRLTMEAVHEEGGCAYDRP